VHLEDLLHRNRKWTNDLRALADERRWPRDATRSHRIAELAYSRAPDERWLWSWTMGAPQLASLAGSRDDVARLFRHPPLQR
jgi:hypothetical protein